MASMSPMGSVSSFGGSVSSKEMKARERRRKEELRAKLSGLPAPQYEYELVAPEVCTSVCILLFFFFFQLNLRGFHLFLGFRFFAAAALPDYPSRFASPTKL